ncbi:MAG: phosphatase PAP2 family protein [Flavobacteriaceae bacterium]
MISRFLFIAFLVIQASAISQNLHPLEPVKGHYKDLQRLSTSPNSEHSQLDAISFPSSEYRSAALIYIMATPEYLTPEQVETLKDAVQFPANSSDQTRAELDFLLEWQEKRSPEEVHRAAEVLAPIGYWPHISVMKNHQRYQKNMEHLFYEGKAVMGDQCTAKNYPATAKLLAGVTKDMRIMEFTVKYHLLRARPYHLEPKLKPLARMSSPSFASGHTLWAYIQAFTWSELIPEKRKEFLEVAYEVGESREIMGIHYPSDEEAARVLAHKMLTDMWGNPKFQDDLRKAQLEWKK